LEEDKYSAISLTATCCREADNDSKILLQSCNE
jgi:hypothetical protein